MENTAQNSLPQDPQPSPHFLNGGFIQQAALLPPLPPQMFQPSSWNWGFGNGQGNMGEQNYMDVLALSHQALQNAQNSYNYQQVQQQQQYTQQEYNNGAQQYGNNNSSNRVPPYPQHSMTSGPSAGLFTQIPPFIEENDHDVDNGSTWTTNMTNLPECLRGGLDVLWREVPEECQRMLTDQDVPESAKSRGYFTVFELLALKRILVARLSAYHNPAERDSSNATSVGRAVRAAMNTIQNNNDHQNSSNHSSTSEVDENSENGNSKPQATEPNGSSEESSAAPSTMSAGSSGDKSGNSFNSNSSVAPPPPYRASALAFKILQIGHYQFRSFSKVTPNILRVLFNSQRITYECPLTIAPPPTDEMLPLRKLLTVDISFDQISMIKFGIDKLFLKVEGAPLMTVSYNPANHDTSCPTLSEQDRQLLKQIDKGQLKLSPWHQLYFLNERLVHLLELELRDHPRFKNMFQTNNMYNHTQRHHAELQQQGHVQQMQQNQQAQLQQNQQSVAKLQ